MKNFCLNSNHFFVWNVDIDFSVTILAMKNHVCKLWPCDYLVYLIYKLCRYLQSYVTFLNIDVKEVEMIFMHPKPDGFWDWPNKNDQTMIQSRFIFLGPCIPTAPTKRGFRFSEDEEPRALYRHLKNNKQ